MKSFLVPTDDEWHFIPEWPIAQIEMPTHAGSVDIDSEGVGWVRAFSRSDRKCIKVEYRLGKGNNDEKA